MADSVVVEGIKLFGGIAGLATAAFTIWDRAFRDRPQVWVTADPIFESGQRYLYVVVRNPAPVQIRVTSISVAPNLFVIWRDHSLEAAVDSGMGVKAAIFIDGESDHRFPILLTEEVSEENLDILCRITVHWQSMRHEHIPCIPVTHRKTIRTLKAQRSNQA